MSIHTWPEKGYAALDVFVCGDCQPQKAIPVLRRALVAAARAAHGGGFSIGIGAPGPQAASGLMKNCNSNCLNGQPFPRDLEAALGQPVALANDANCLAVSEAVDGARLLPGHAYIAPGGLHLSVERSGANYIARVRDGEPVNRHKPSVEVLFKSAARVLGPNALGIMLTGMGADGAQAMREMKDAGSYNYVQDEASCVVYGMPREAVAQGAVNEVLPLSQIAPRLVEWLRANAGTVTSRRYRSVVNP